MSGRRRIPLARVLLLIGSLATYVVSASAQSPASSAPPAGAQTPAAQPTGTAALHGIVVADAGGAPIRLAHVVLIGAATGALRVTASDASGRFAFDNLPADRYTVGASKLPYLGSVAGARRAARPGSSVAVADGARVEQVTIRMPLGAAISGTITNEHGTPAVGALVGLMHRRLQGRQRLWVPAPGGTIPADDTGRYRLHGLPPGEYLVVATALGGVPPRRLSDAEVDAALSGGRPSAAPAAAAATTRAPIYFPGTARQDQAAPILLGVGEDRPQVDFQLAFVPTSSLEITLGSADGPPPQVTTITVDGSMANALRTRSQIRVAGGQPARAGNLAPGTYRLVAREAGATGRLGSALVELTGVDQVVQLVLQAPVTLSGRLQFVGSATSPSLAGRRVPLRSQAPAIDGVADPQVRPTDEQGLFSVTGLLAGEFVIGGPLYFGATSDSVTWTLESVVADGADVTDVPMTIAPDSMPREVVVTYTDRWQELTGRLVDAAGAPAADYTVVVFPSDRRYWVEGSRRIQTARPGSDGRFRLGGPGPSTLPPGTYLLAVVADLDRDEQYDPALLATLAGSATEIVLRAGERRVQDLAIR